MRPGVVALVVAGTALTACDWFTPRSPRGSFTPSPTESAGCEVCGDSKRSAAKVYRVEAPAEVKAGKAATFTFYVTTGVDPGVVCESPQPTANLPGWGVVAGARPPRVKLGVVLRGFTRDETKPCPVLDRAAAPKSARVRRTLTFPAAGSYAVEVEGFDGARPLGMQYSPGPGEPPAPPAPSAPSTIEVLP